MNLDFYNTLGLCRRAGFISWGHDAAIQSIKSNKARICIITADASDRLKKEFERTVEYYKSSIPVIFIDDDMDRMRDAIGLRTAVITVNDEGFTNLLKKHISNKGEV